jgi:riboflavin transporter FmnP
VTDKNHSGKGKTLDSRAIAAIIVFSALAIVLNLSPIKIPAPYAPFLIYQIWEVPLVAAFLLYGPPVGIVVSGVNTLALLILFPGALITGPLYDLIAVLSMLFGIYVIHKVAIAFAGSFAGTEYSIEIVTYVLLTMLTIMGALVQSLLWLLPAIVFGLLSLIVSVESRQSKIANPRLMPQGSSGRYSGFLISATTVSGAFMRVMVMTLVNFTVLSFPPPIGFSMPREAVIAILPLIGLFNATLASYTIPIGHTIARIVSSRIRSRGLT